MSKWATRATAHFLQTGPEPTPITPETQVMGVLGVPPTHILEITTPSLAVLMTAAMKACDHHHDSAQAREDMRQQVTGTPMELRLDLLRHFTNVYGGGA